MINRRPSRQVKTFLDSSRIRRKRQRRKIFMLIMSIFLLTAVMGGGVIALRASAFQLKTISVVGSGDVNIDKLKELVKDSVTSQTHLLGLVQPTSSFFINDREIEDLIKTTYPRISSAEVDSSLSGTISVRIEEFKRFGIWCTDDNSRCYEFDQNGRIFDQLFGEKDISVDMRDNQPTLIGLDAEDAEGVSNLADDEATLARSSRASTTEDGRPVEPKRIILRTDSAKSIASTTGQLVSSTSTASVDDESANPAHARPEFAYYGLITDAPIGQMYLDAVNLTAITSIISTLRSMNLHSTSVNCISEKQCDIKLEAGGRIIVDPSADISLALDRFKVAVQSDALKSGKFNYVDLRFGNKIFYKVTGDTGDGSAQNNAQNASSTATTTRKTVQRASRTASSTNSTSTTPGN